MAYQPVFVTIEDTNGPAGQSHSCRRKVEWVSIWANTKNGKMFDGSIRADGGYLRLGDNFTAEATPGGISIRLKEEIKNG